MVTEKDFREDLWYRIAVFPILIPPLRERLADIPALVEHFIRKATIRFGFPEVQVSEQDLIALQHYEWPGNIRELAAVGDRAVILGEGRSLEVESAMGISSPTPVNHRLPASTPSAAGGSLAGHLVVQPPESLDAAMRQQIERALEATRGRIEGVHGAAALLRINPHTLRARMRKLGIDWAQFRMPRIP